MLSSKHPADTGHQPPLALPTRLHTKQNLPPTFSPNTTANNRRRLGGLFSDLDMGSPLRARGSPSARSRGGSTAGAAGGVGPSVRAAVTTSVTSFADRLSALSLATAGRANEVAPGNKVKGDCKVEVDEWDEGCFVDGMSERNTGSLPVHSPLVIEEDDTLGLMDLHDDILLEIVLQMPCDLQTLKTLSQVSKRLYNLSRSPILWARVLRDSGLMEEVRADVKERAVAVWEEPMGTWDDLEFTPSKGDDEQQDRPGDEPPSSICIHYPTLYRTLHTLPKTVRSLPPHHPPNVAVLEGHQDSVYCVQFEGRWMITGSRDKSLGIWDLSAIGDVHGGLIKMIENAHDRSILGLQFELDSHGRGVLMTASSDSTAALWSLDLSGHAGDAINVVKMETFHHPSAVLDVALTPTYIVTASKDCRLRVYSRKTLKQVAELAGHRGPVNCITTRRPGPGDHREEGEREEVVSASGDGSWIIWDVQSGKQVRKGAGDGRGIACVAWEGDCILTGDNECLIKLYDARKCELVRAFKGHSNLVRSVSLRLREGLVISGSYDKSVCIWDMHTGHLIKRPTLPDQDALIFDLQMSSNRLVVVGLDHVVKILTWGETLPYSEYLI